MRNELGPFYNPCGANFPEMVVSNHTIELSIVIPCNNEQENVKPLEVALGDLVNKLAIKKIEIEIVFVDNASLDKTVPRIIDAVDSSTLLKKNRIAIYSLARNYGFQHSILFGLAQCRGRSAVVFQSDLQDPIDLVPKFYEAWEEGHLAVAGVITSRTGENRFTSMLRKAFYQASAVLSGGHISKNVLDFYLLDRKVIEEVVAQKPKYELLRTYISRTYGFTKTYNYERRPRTAGRPSLRLTDYARISTDSFISNLDKVPIFMTAISASVAAAACLGLIALTSAYLLGWRSGLAGWASLVAIALGALAFFGLISALQISYLSRILSSRPESFQPQISRALIKESGGTLRETSWQ